jgi:hypothetical protein
MPSAVRSIRDVPPLRGEREDPAAQEAASGARGQRPGYSAGEATWGARMDDESDERTEGDPAGDSHAASA